MAKQGITKKTLEKTLKSQYEDFERDSKKVNEKVKERMLSLYREKLVASYGPRSPGNVMAEESNKYSKSLTQKDGKRRRMQKYEHYTQLNILFVNTGVEEDENGEIYVSINEEEYPDYSEKRNMRTRTTWDAYDALIQGSSGGGIYPYEVETLQNGKKHIVYARNYPVEPHNFEEDVTDKINIYRDKLMKKLLKKYDLD